MNPWFAKALVLAANVLLVVIRAPHGHRSRGVRVVKNWRGRLENSLLTLAWAAFFPPVIWAFIPGRVFGDYSLDPVPLACGTVCYAVGLWIFHRSHADLGRNWSITLEVREEHRLITNGVYRRVRHPMYVALTLFGLGQALVLPNWLIGPLYLVAFLILFALRVGREERMMLEEFGEEYRAYQARTRRLVPGLW